MRRQETHLTGEAVLRFGILLQEYQEFASRELVLDNDGQCVTMVDYYDQHDAERMFSIPEAQAFLAAFTTGLIDIATFAGWFSSFSQMHGWKWTLASVSVQQPFCTWVNQFRGIPGFEEELKVAMVLPSSAEEAEERMRHFIKFMISLRVMGMKERELSIKKIPAIIGAFWHLQDPKRYILYYNSIRETLGRIGAYRPSEDVADNYFALTAAIKELQTIWTIDLYTLEHVCVQAVEGSLHMPGHILIGNDGTCLIGFD